MIGSYAAGMSTLLAVASGWQGGAAIVDNGDGSYSVAVAETADGFVDDLGSGLFGIDDTAPATDRINVEPDSITIEDF